MKFKAELSDEGQLLIDANGVIAPEVSLVLAKCLHHIKDEAGLNDEELLDMFLTAYQFTVLKGSQDEG